MDEKLKGFLKIKNGEGDELNFKKDKQEVVQNKLIIGNVKLVAYHEIGNSLSLFIKFSVVVFTVFATSVKVLRFKEVKEKREKDLLYAV